MKVYLVTRRAGYNFGSSLQAFALQQIFINKGLSCEILDIKEMRLRGKVRIYFLNMLARIFLYIDILKYIVGDRRYNLIVQSYYQRKKFDYFNNQILKVSPRLYNEQKLSSYIGKGNIIVCGSDQIWNPIGFSPILFLSFVNPAENIMASYAPSIGLDKLTSHENEIKYLINRFHYLSVREEAGLDILKGMTNKEVELVLDPTLMVEKKLWDSLEEPIENLPAKFILCYFLSTNNYPISYIQQLKNTYQCEIINIQTNYNSYFMEGAINRSDIGPRNFLYLVKHALHICTNSFHCCIFSHIYCADFSVFSRFEQSDKANQNSRIKTLLKILNEESRWVDSKKTIQNSSYSCNCFMKNEMLRISKNYINRIVGSLV